MKKVLSTCLALLLLAACQQDDTVPAVELPFETHPSVLRGDWTGTILNIPYSKISTLELTNLVADCADVTEQRICERYTFTGRVSVDGAASVPLSGEGFASDYAFTVASLDSPKTPLVYGTFEFDAELWELSASYGGGGFELDGEPSYQGEIGADNNYPRGSAFLLEPTP